MASGRLRELLDKPSHTLTSRERSIALKLLKEEKQRVDNMRAADQMAGVGLPIDAQTREYLRFCNQDLDAGYETPLEKLWDAVSGFFEWEDAEIQQFIRVRHERDHAFNPVDFFAFATDPDIKAQTLTRLRELPEGVIHNYSVKGDVKAVQFQEEGEEPICLSGVAFVRHGNHLHWHLVGGPITDLAKRTAERRALLAEQADLVRQNNPNQSEKEINHILSPSAEALPGTDDVWLCGAMGLFNLAHETHEMRMTIKEWGVSQAVFSDQFEQKYADVYDTNPAVKRMVDKAMVQLEKDHIYFEIFETALTLPAYFAAKVEFIATDAVQTALGNPDGGMKRKHALKAPLNMRVLVRNVATLDFQRTGEIGGNYTPPRYRVELEGYWRRLPPRSVGHDAQGDPMLGKTWVRAHARWKDLPPKAGVLRVKTAIGETIERASKLVARRGGSYRLRAT